MVPGPTVIPEKRSFRKSMELCRRLGGLMAVPNSKEETEALEQVFLTEEEKCGGRLWLGIWDFPDEGNFTNVNTGETVRLINRTV